MEFRSWLEEHEKKRADEIMPEADKILPVVIGAGPGGITRQKLGKAIQLPWELLNDLLNALVASGQISLIPYGDEIAIRAGR